MLVENRAGKHAAFRTRGHTNGSYVTFNGTIYGVEADDPWVERFGVRFLGKFHSLFVLLPECLVKSVSRKIISARTEEYTMMESLSFNLRA